jgi:hypothetical protein
MKPSNVLEKELQESKILLVHRYLRTRKQAQDRYCPVVTYDGITKNPNYRQRPMRNY